MHVSVIQSMVAFLKDPSGPPLWEENPDAKDVVHVETEKVSNQVLVKTEFNVEIEKLEELV